VTRALARLTWVELKLFAREPLAVVFAFAFPLVVLSVLAGIFGSEPNSDFGYAVPRDYYLAGYVGVVIACVGLIALPVHVAAYRERGILRRFRASSVPASTVFGAQVLVSFVVCVAGSAFLIALAVVAYGAALPDAPAGALLAFVVGTLSILALGFLIAALAPNARAAQALGLTLFFPMWLLSGAGPPRSIMTGAMRDIGDALPLTHVVKALQDPWLGRGTNGGQLALLVAILVVVGAIGLRLARD
jgi:ABC-2 type transport system permease protein